MRSTLTLAGALLATAATLAACGGSATTVDDVPTTVAPLPASGAPAAPSGAAASSAAATSAAAAGAGAGAAQPSFGQDSTREISEIPTPQGPDLDPKGKDYLDTLAKAGITTEGVEQQLLGIATDVCQQQAEGKQPYLVDAIAGQLVEQQRSTLTPEDTSRAISEAAHTYCS